MVDMGSFGANTVTVFQAVVGVAVSAVVIVKVRPPDITVTVVVAVVANVFTFTRVVGVDVAASVTVGVFNAPSEGLAAATKAGAIMTAAMIIMIKALMPIMVN